MQTDAGQLVFYLFSFIVIISAIYVVTLKNIFHSAIFLVLTLFGVAGIYILLHAEFLAAVQVLIYVGAVSVLMIFAIMLTTRLASREIRQSNEQVMAGIFIGAGFLLASLGSFANTVWHIVDKPLPENNTLTLGQLLMNEYVLPFEVVSIVLLAALIGAVVLARKEGA
ncbi:NADH dehydrogenase I subunit J [Candidatus Zixiibacteriota bacterium]|nr:NADH dehydrogenase I subunit J [candidate division Zixibacteria bacterium]